MSEPEKTFTAVEHVYRAWPLFAGAIGFMAWLLRLEAKVNYLEKELKETREDFKALEIKNAELLSTIQKDIRDVLQLTARMEGKLERNKS